MIFLSASGSPTPTPIYIDNLPDGFSGYFFNFMTQLFNMLRQIEIPFTHVNCYQVFIGTISLALIFYGLSLIYGRGNGKDHE